VADEGLLPAPNVCVKKIKQHIDDLNDLPA